MAQLVINIEDTSLIPSLKRILGAIKGVTISKPQKDSFRVDPYEISPSGDTFFADSRNVKAVEEDIAVECGCGCRYMIHAVGVKRWCAQGGECHRLSIACPEGTRGIGAHIISSAHPKGVHVARESPDCRGKVGSVIAADNEIGQGVPTETANGNRGIAVRKKAAAESSRSVEEDGNRVGGQYGQLLRGKRLLVAVTCSDDIGGVGTYIIGG